MNDRYSHLFVIVISGSHKRHEMNIKKKMVRRYIYIYIFVLFSREKVKRMFNTIFQAFVSLFF